MSGFASVDAFVQRLLLAGQLVEEMVVVFVQPNDVGTDADEPV